MLVYIQLYKAIFLHFTRAKSTNYFISWASQCTAYFHRFLGFVWPDLFFTSLFL